ncbi:MAG: cation-translocating P-type ATPase [Candidatus Sericytochromatia bacterium]|nr:cation-translocating P-type ATPase [Candidatus Sericytochromatia bacterium]
MEGPNALPPPPGRHMRHAVRTLAGEPMLLLLMGTTGLYALLGAREDALSMVVGVCFVIGLTLAQQWRTRRALEALRAQASPWAVAIRDGQPLRLPARDLVVGDWLIVTAGERLPADAILREGDDVQTDESLLTGESLPVAKRCLAGPPGDDGTAGTEDATLWAGSLVRTGRGLAEVRRTGVRSGLGRLGASLSGITETGEVQDAATRRMVHQLSLIALVACLLATVTHALHEGGSASAWRDGALAGMALAISLIPKELPVVLTVFLAMSAWRLTHRRVLTRHLASLQTLGATSVLCVDKTGTLTSNRMTLVHPDLSDAITATGGSGGTSRLHAPLELGLLACPAMVDDPMDRALHEAWMAQGQGVWQVPEGWLAGPSLKPGPGWTGFGQSWLDASGRTVFQAIKGAPEQVLDLCHLSDAERKAFLRAIAALAGRGMRVLGVAWASPSRTAMASGPQTYMWGGTLAFADPIRPGVKEAVARCREAGIRVVMLTGDHVATARAIAEEAGLDASRPSIEGPELDALDPEDWPRAVADTSVFARVRPEHKLRLVTLLKARGERVTMTGDGVNDAPALLAADVGVAMGRRGADVARETADLILLDDDFPALVEAISEGREVRQKLSRAAAFIVSAHIPIAGLALLPAVAPSLPLILQPIHLVLLELIIDPSCTLVIEADRPSTEVMRRPPHLSDRPLLEAGTLHLALARGLMGASGCLAATLLTWGATASAEQARTAGFSCLGATLVMILLVSRETGKHQKRPNVPLVVLIAAMGSAALIFAMTPGLRKALHLGNLNPDLGLPVGLCITMTLGLLGLSRVFEARELAQNADRGKHGASPGQPGRIRR